MLGICGGLQMLGEALVDPEGHDGEAGFDGPGLGLLPLVTRYEASKRVRHVRLAFGDLEGAWAPWSGLQFEGYEIHCGTTVPHPAMAPPRVALRDERGEPLGWQAGNVLGVYAHGLLESAPLLLAAWDEAARPLETTFDLLADTLEKHIDPRHLEAWLGRPA